MGNQPGNSAENRAGAQPGFYPAEGGRRRYWDGNAWTDRYEDAQGAAGASGMPPEKGTRARRKWLLPAIAALVALFFGIGIGGAGKSGGTTGATPAATVTATVTKAAAAAAPGATVTAPAVTAPAVTVTAPAPPAVTVTAPAVTVTAPAAPTAPPPGPGTSVEDGIYVVGQDMQPGTYRVTAAVVDRCYWALTKTGSNGADIIQNDLPAGGFPQVTVKVGQDFTTKRCGTWVKK